MLFDILEKSRHTLSTGLLANPLKLLITFNFVLILAKPI